MEALFMMRSAFTSPIGGQGADQVVRAHLGHALLVRGEREELLEGQLTRLHHALHFGAPATVRHRQSRSFHALFLRQCRRCRSHAGQTTPGRSIVLENGCSDRRASAGRRRASSRRSGPARRIARDDAREHGPCGRSARRAAPRRGVRALRADARHEVGPAQRREIEVRARHGWRPARRPNEPRPSSRWFSSAHVGEAPSSSTRDRPRRCARL